MVPIFLGTDCETNQPVDLDPDLFRTNFHLIGATGTGKTTAIHTMLRPLLADPSPKCALFLVDPMGNLSRDLLLWIANERLCPEHVRRRLLYIEPAREDLVLPFNPLIHSSDDHLYYQCGRAVEIMLRAWASQNIEEMPRLRRWMFASFFSVASMGLPISMCRWLLTPGTPEHLALLSKLTPELQGQWSEILNARGSEAVRILESTRNRLAPFFESGILRRMFGSTNSRFDVARFIRERRIVILNVASLGKLDQHIASTIGGLAVNEVIQTARNMTPSEVNPTYLLLDEFQNFVSNDLFEALPIVRQLGLRLILSHQSFSQLERGEIDLTQMIWQARSRLMFANDSEDADLLAHELATLTYDPKKLKEILYSTRQRTAGYKREWLKGVGKTSTESHARDRGKSRASGQNDGESLAPNKYQPTKSNSSSKTVTETESEKDAESHGFSESESETLVPILEDLTEVASKNYSSFDEQTVEWAKRLRTSPTGRAFGKFKDDPRLYEIDIDHHPITETKALLQKYDELLAKNFELEFFQSKAAAELEGEQLRELVLNPAKIFLAGPTLDVKSETGKPSNDQSDNPPATLPRVDPFA